MPFSRTATAPRVRKWTKCNFTLLKAQRAQARFMLKFFRVMPVPLHKHRVPVRVQIEQTDKYQASLIKKMNEIRNECE